MCKYISIGLIFKLKRTPKQKSFKSSRKRKNDKKNSFVLLDSGIVNCEAIYFCVVHLGIIGYI